MHETKQAIHELLPNFIIGGGGESGTSFLHKMLIQHPQIFLPSRMIPETGFFNKRQEYAKGIEYYKTHFVEWAGQQAVGERTSGYLHIPQSAERIRRYLPDVKLIFCLRNPVERAFTNYRFSCQQGLETWSFSQAARCEHERVACIRDPFWQDVAPYSYVDRGLYYDDVMRFYDCFDRSQILLIKSETMRDRWLEEVRRAFSFLGVAHGFAPKKEIEFNTSDVHSRRLQAWLRKRYGGEFPQLIENSRIPGHAVPRLIRLNLRRRRRILKEPDRRYLQQIYAESNRKLADLTGWDLSDWN